MAKYTLKITVAKLGEDASGKPGAEIDSAVVSSHGLSLANVKAMRKEIADLLAKFNEADVDVK